MHSNLMDVGCTCTGVKLDYRLRL